MTGREALPPVGLERWLLLFDNVNHPRHAISVDDATESVRPEGLLPAHLNLAVGGEIVEPAFPLLHITGVEHGVKPA